MTESSAAAQKQLDAATLDSAARPKLVALPSGSAAEFFTREQLTIIYRCSHGELGRLLARRLAPLPIRVDGVILWFTDESMAMAAQVARTLERWRK